ncbi:MAG: extensin family protein [Myxococcota bacterium]|nr:extensin family protein [Myxococcota bacterium]
MQASRILVLLSLCWLTFACARESRGVKTPDYDFAPWVTPPPPGQQGKAPAKTDRMQPGAEALARSQRDPITTPFRAPLPSDFALPGGQECLNRLSARGVQARPLDAKRGVDTPVVIHGPIGGVRFWSTAGPMVLDCRLALALSEVAPDFSGLGIESVRFSGAYVYRTMRKGRLSLHAYGLAIDVHEVRTASGTQTVKRNFLRGTRESCDTDEPIPNQLACRLKRRGLFRELLTPDYNADHHDHLHLGIAPLPTSAAVLRTFQVPSAKVTQKDRSRKAGAKVKPARKSQSRRAVRVEPVATRPRVPRLRSDLKDVPEVRSDILEFSPTNPPSKLLPIETQRPELVGAGGPEKRAADAPVAGSLPAFTLDGHPEH